MTRKDVYHFHTLYQGFSWPNNEYRITAKNEIVE